MKRSRVAVQVTPGVVEVEEVGSVLRDCVDLETGARFNRILERSCMEDCCASANLNSRQFNTRFNSQVLTVLQSNSQDMISRSSVRYSDQYISAGYV